MASAQQGALSVGWYRWVVCGLLFIATTVNYVDRQVISVLKPVLEKEMGWNQIDYSNIVVCFQLAYAIGLVLMGRFVDRIGVKIGFALAVFFWSIAAIAHGLVVYIPHDWMLTLSKDSWGQSILIFFLYGTGAATTFMLPMTIVAFASARFALGIAEAGNFPACIKAVSEWFPKKERALATGIFNSGTNIGALLTPVVVPWMTVHWGWSWAFYITGAIGFLWLVVWWWEYDDDLDRQPNLSKQELEYIRSDPQDPPAEKIPWIKLLGYRQTWAFAIGKFMTDPFWWLYLFWVPDFLDKQYHLSIKEFGLPLVIIYTMTCFGSVGGGWLSSKLIRSGWTVNASRKTAMLVCALSVVPILAASQVSNLWLAVFLIGLAASAHAGWSANIFTLVSDTVPKAAVSSVTGFGGMAGAVGGMLIAKIVGYVLERTNNNYFIPFAMAAVAYLLALVIIHLLLPRLEQMKLDPKKIA
ncbi:MAG: MFS transporter [Verrucomicrobiia bacterium]